MSFVDQSEDCLAGFPTGEVAEGELQGQNPEDESHKTPRRFH